MDVLTTLLGLAMFYQPKSPRWLISHGRLYGGFLMHCAFELVLSTWYTFNRLVLCFLEVDHVDFLRPIDVGDFLSQILYSVH